MGLYKTLFLFLRSLLLCDNPYLEARNPKSDHHGRMCFSLPTSSLQSQFAWRLLACSCQKFLVTVRWKVLSRLIFVSKAVDFVSGVSTECALQITKIVVLFDNYCDTGSGRYIDLSLASVFKMFFITTPNCNT
jgi:hypothetical protein